jgi:hypothetical protein
METEQSLDRILSDELLADVRSEVVAAFHMLDALAFAKRLRGYAFADSIKSELLALKVQTPQKSKTDALEVVLQAGISNFWDRLTLNASGDKR